MKYAILSGMLYLSIIVQTTLFPRLNLFGVQPDLLCAVLVAASIAFGPVIGGIMGALSGLVLDFMFMHPGFYALQYMILCLLVGFVAAKAPFDRFLLPSAACFAGYALKELVTLLYLYLQRVEISFAIASGKLFLGGALTVLLLLPIYQAVRAISKFSLMSDHSIFGEDGN